MIIVMMTNVTNGSLYNSQSLFVDLGGSLLIKPALDDVRPINCTDLSYIKQLHWRKRGEIVIPATELWLILRLTRSLSG